MSKKEKENDRKIGVKNYLILALIFTVATIVTLYLCNVYSVYQESKLEIPILRGILSEITSEEFDHYISENPTALIYICTASNITCRNYEKDLKKLINKEELHDKIIYLNISAEEKEKFIEEFNKKYTKRIKLTEKYPAFVTIEDGKVVHILQPKENEKLTITKTQQFIDLHEIGE